jgi:precorrin-6Y C5,15-methyltransferase (decarboxylating)
MSVGTGWGVVHVVGIGDAGAETLAPAQRALVEAADLLCGGARHLAFFPEHPAERFTVRANIEEFVALLEQAIGRRRAVVLASGDPSYFGIGPVLARRLGAERVRIHPAAGSIALACARLGLAQQDVTVLSAHGRPLAGIVPRALQHRLLLILTDNENAPARVAAALRDAGMENARATVCERLGGPAERLTRCRLDELAGRAFDPLNVLVIERDACALPAAPAFGLHESQYDSERGQITKAEVRAVSLSKLQPWRLAVAWDIGAGSGALAIELAGLMPPGRVFAVERDSDQLAVLRRNLARYPRPNLRVVCGAAPAALDGLPRPDGVFVGGAGAELPTVLEIAAERLQPGGRLVANFARLEALAQWQRFVAARDWAAEIVQLTVARGTPLGDGTRLAPLGPVFVTAATRPEAER